MLLLTVELADIFRTFTALPPQMLLCIDILDFFMFNNYWLWEMISLQTDWNKSLQGIHIFRAPFWIAIFSVNVP